MSAGIAGVAKQRLTKTVKLYCILITRSLFDTEVINFLKYYTTLEIPCNIKLKPTSQTTLKCEFFVGMSANHAVLPNTIIQ